MKRRRKLLDTNHLSEATRPRSVVRDRIRRESRDGVVFGTCIPVLCEQEFGFRGLLKAQEARRELRVVLDSLRIWPLDGGLASLYGEIAHDLRRRGRALSQVDLMLAALSLQMGLVLLTSDRDFEAVPGLRAEDWLS